MLRFPNVCYQYLDTAIFVNDKVLQFYISCYLCEKQMANAEMRQLRIFIEGRVKQLQRIQGVVVDILSEGYQREVKTDYS